MNHVISGSDALDTVFAAIGTGLDSPRLAAALAVLGGEFTTSPVRREGGETTQYVESRAGGVEVLVTDGLVDSFFLFVNPVGRPAFMGIGDLVPGLRGDSTREEVQALLGPAVRSMRIYDFYGGEGRFVHTEFDDEGRLALVTLMGIDILA